MCVNSFKVFLSFISWLQTRKNKTLCNIINKGSTPLLAQKCGIFFCWCKCQNHTITAPLSDIFTWGFNSNVQSSSRRHHLRHLWVRCTLQNTVSSNSTKLRPSRSFLAAKVLTHQPSAAGSWKSSPINYFCWEQ